MTEIIPVRERDLTPAERFVWGECPICGVEDGEACQAYVGVQLGIRSDGSLGPAREGAHLARLNNAPFQVKEVPV